jgi:hypothetical protein
MTQPSALSVIRNRAAVAEELRRLLPRMEEDFRAARTVPLGLSVIDRHLPRGGLPCGALHEVVPETQGATPAAFGFIAALLIRLSTPPAISSPPPCGEGLGVGGGRPSAGLDALRQPRDPPPHPTPQRGGGTGRRAALRARPPRPAAWSRPRHSRPRSGAPDPGRDRPSARHPVGHGGGAAFTCPASRRRHGRQARSEIEPKAAARRGGCGTAASAAAACVDAGIERGGNALAHRHGQGRARPFRSDRAAALASYA